MPEVVSAILFFRGQERQSTTEREKSRNVWLGLCVPIHNLPIVGCNNQLPICFLVWVTASTVRITFFWLQDPGGSTFAVSKVQILTLGYCVISSFASAYSPLVAASGVHNRVGLGFSDSKGTVLHHFHILGTFHFFFCFSLGSKEDSYRKVCSRASIPGIATEAVSHVLRGKGTSINKGEFRIRDSY
jgi:hypothetical protein